MDRCGAKLNLSKSPDEHVLKRIIIIKLQKRVLAGAATLLIKAKAHRRDPLNEEAHIRAEMGRRKEQKEVGWNNPTDRTIYRWKVGQHTRLDDQTHGPTQSEIDSAKKREKSKSISSTGNRSG
jgi:hypothetical protein